MGVMLPDVVKAMRPEHAGHDVAIRHRWAPGFDGVIPERTWWECSCGIAGNFAKDETGEALRSGRVMPT